MPTPLLVVNDQGTVIYLNQALLALGGWEINEESDLNLLNYVHPEDRESLAEAFLEIVASPGARVLGSGRPWAEIYVRMITADGETVPVEVVGAGGLLDPGVGGIIYEVRAARNRDLLGHVLDGLSHGASMHQMLSLVAEMIASPPLDMQAVILQSTDDQFIVVSSTSPELSDIVRGPIDELPWAAAESAPAFVELHELPDAMRTQLRAAGFQDVWHLAVESPLTDTTLRIVGASPTHHVPANGPRNRLVRARELAAAVLLRTQSGVLLEHAAKHDALTDLPNRAAFYRLTEAVNPMLQRAALHLHVDGIRPVSDEYGDDTGDAVRQIIADRLRSTCSSTDIVGRVGDDEFAVVRVPGIDDHDDALLQGAKDLAAELVSVLQEIIVVAGRPMVVSPSIGVAVATSGISTDHLLTWANAAMRDARRVGKGHIRQYGMSFD